MITDPISLEVFRATSGQRVQKRATDYRRVLNHAPQVCAALRVQAVQPGVEDFDFQAEPRTGALKKMRKGWRYHEPDLAGANKSPRRGRFLSAGRMCLFS